MDVVLGVKAIDIIIGDTLIRTLRKAYGTHFAEGCRDDDQPRDVMHRLDEPTLGTLIHDQQHGKLEEICRQAS
jgi:hypothetical protein